MARSEGHRDNGPAARTSALAQRRAGSRGRARQEQRTDHELDDAPLQAQLLEVLEEPCRPVVDTGARLARLWTCVTKIEPNVDNERVGQVMSRERGALGVAVRVHRATHPHQRPVTRSQQPGRLEGGAGRLGCGRCRRCFSSACDSENGVRVGLKNQIKYVRRKEDRSAHPTPCPLAPALNRVAVNWRTREAAPRRLMLACRDESPTRERPPKGTHKMDYVTSGPCRNFFVARRWLARLFDRGIASRSRRCLVSIAVLTVART